MEYGTELTLVTGECVYVVEFIDWDEITVIDRNGYATWTISEADILD